MLDITLELSETPVELVAHRVHVQHLPEQVLHSVMFNVGFVDLPAVPKSYVADGRIEDLFFRSSMHHQIVINLVEQRLSHRTVKFWGHFECHHETTNHSVIFLQNRRHPHRTTTNHWN